MTQPVRCALVTAVKNEGPDLLEWVAYHRSIGFDPIIIYSNDCDDGSDLMLDAMAEIGWIEHHRHKPAANVAPQDAVAELAWQNPNLRAADWSIWLDADEFLNIAAPGGRIADLIASAGQADAIALNWRNFGDNGHTHSTEDLVLSRFDKAAALNFRLSRTVKTLHRTSDKVESLFIHRPIWKAGLVNMLDGAGRNLPDEFVFAPKKNARPEELVPKGRQSYVLGQINHYAIKALDRVAIKQRRGNGLVAGGGSSRFGFGYLRRFNRNEETDRSIQSHIPATRALMAEALAVSQVAAAYHECWRNFRASLSAVLPITESLAADRTGKVAKEED